MIREFFHDLWVKAVFFVGKIRRLDKFPWVTWAVVTREIDYEEIMEMVDQLEYGDVGLHREAGYLENLAISGFMIHAWIHTEDGYTGKIVEAVSEGVLHRNYLYALYSDFTIILSPKNVTEEERKGACKKAKQIVGSKYDPDFKFDIEEEIKYWSGQNEEEARAHLKEGARWLKKYEPAFTCTEVAAYSWWHKREDLRLFRTKRLGKSVILADTFINHGWEIKWMSRSVTPETAKALGVPEEGLLMIEEYLKNKQKN